MIGSFTLVGIILVVFKLVQGIRNQIEQQPARYEACGHFNVCVGLCGNCATTVVPQDRFQGLRKTSGSFIIEMLSGRGGEGVVWCPLD